MSYRLNAITIHVNSAKEYKREMKEIWRDITNGKLPILFDSEHNFQQGISPIYQYSNYAQNDFDLSVMGVASEFFKQMELKVIEGFYKKYDFSDTNGDMELCSQKAWEQVKADCISGLIERAYICDYESNVPPEYTKDGKAHCYLYISVTINEQI